MKRLLPFLFLVLAILLLAAIPLLRLDKYRMQIADSLSQRLGRRVVIGRLEAALFPPAMRLRDVAIMNPAGDAPLLQADQITAPVHLKSLLKGVVVPQAIHLRNWSAVVNRRADATWALDEWMSPGARLSEKAGWPVSAITFDRGECKAVDRYGPGPAEFVVQILQGEWESGKKYVSVNGVFTSLPAPVSFLFQANGDFLSQGTWSGVLGMTDESRQFKFECKVAPGHTTASSGSQAWRLDTAYTFLRYYGRLPVERPIASPSSILQAWEGHYDWQGNSLNYSQAATISGGRGEAKGTVTFTSSAPTATLDIGLQSANIQPLETALLGSAPMEGIGTGLAHFALTLSSASWSTLNGQGALDVAEGHYYLPGSATQNLSKAHTYKYLLKKYPTVLSSGLPFSKSRVRWQVKNGMFTFNDAFANLGDIQVAGVGTYDAARHGLDAYTRVQINERNSALMKELPQNYVVNGRILPMNGRVQGTPGEWRLRASRGSKIPPAVQNKLSQTIKQK